VSLQYFSGAAVDADPVAFDERAAGHADRARLVVDLEVARSGDAHLAHLPGDESRVARHAAARGQDTGGGLHALDVLGRCLDAHEDRRFPARGEFLRVRWRERDASARGARAGSEAFAERASGGARRPELLDRATGRRS
jgi:hypothetical protein